MMYIHQIKKIVELIQVKLKSVILKSLYISMHYLSMILLTGWISSNFKFE